MIIRLWVFYVFVFSHLRVFVACLFMFLLFFHASPKLKFISNVSAANDKLLLWWTGNDKKYALTSVLLQHLNVFIAKNHKFSADYCTHYGWAINIYEILFKGNKIFATVLLWTLQTIFCHTGFGRFSEWHQNRIKSHIAKRSAKTQSEKIKSDAGALTKWNPERTTSVFQFNLSLKTSHLILQ